MRSSLKKMCSNRHPGIPGWRFFTHCIFAVAGLTGFEPATSRVTGERSKPLSYNPTPCIIGRKYQIPSENPTTRMRSGN